MIPSGSDPVDIARLSTNAGAPTLRPTVRSSKSADLPKRGRLPRPIQRRGRVPQCSYCERAAIRRGLKLSQGEVRDVYLDASPETLMLAAESQEEGETSVT